MIEGGFFKYIAILNHRSVVIVESFEPIDKGQNRGRGQNREKIISMSGNKQLEI
jgi:hypothetical protein